MSKKDPSIIRVGDHIKIMRPFIFLRCGYPLYGAEVRQQILEQRGPEIGNLLNQLGLTDNSKFRRQAMSAILSGLTNQKMQLKKFGGNERKIYVMEIPKLKGRIYQVEKIKMVMTGTYVPGPTCYSHEYDDDYNPPYLDKVHTHKILTLQGSYFHDACDQWREQEAFQLLYPNFPSQIESIHVTKNLSENLDSQIF